MISTNDRNCTKLKDVSNLYQLDQLITAYTRVTETSSTIIDLIFTSDKNMHTKTGIFPVSVSDHFLIFTVIGKIFVKSFENTINYRDFTNFDQEKFLHDLSLINWSDALEYDKVKFDVEKWYSLFTEVLNKHAQTLILKK